MGCPPSIDLCAKMPAGGTSTYAEEGTALHEALEWLLLDPDRVPIDCVGMTFNDHHISLALCNECVVPAWEAAVEIVGVDEYYLEATLPFPGIEGSFGTVDLMAVSDDKKTMRGGDYKFGAGVPVPVEDTKQPQFSLAAARAHLGIDPEVMEFSIIQPRLDYVGKATYTKADIDAFEMDLKHRVEHRDKYNLAEGSWCRWCSARAACPLKLGNIEELRKAEVAAKNLPRLMRLREDVAETLNAIDTLAHNTLEAGIPIQGWKLVAKKGHRKWVDPDKTDKWLARRGIKIDQRSPRKLVSPAQAEKLIKPKKLPKDMAVAPIIGTKIVDEGDPAPAVTPGEGKQKVAAKLRDMAK
jgi:hypothetical protein